MYVQWRTESEEEALWRYFILLRAGPQVFSQVRETDNGCMLARVHSSLQQRIFINPNKLSSIPAFSTERLLQTGQVT